MNNKWFYIILVFIGTCGFGSDYKNSIGVEFMLIPGGEFMMGSTETYVFSDPSPVHKVTISKPFYMGKYEVTQAQWETVTGYNPSHFKGENSPVEMVIMAEVKKFIRQLNEIEGGEYYRLPTEAEWEYACRAGSTGAYAGTLDDMAWYTGNAWQTHDVGKKLPNAIGLYDMHGNVWEYCSDWFGPYSSDSVVDPKGPKTGEYYVDRGGGWTNNADVNRSYTRGLHSEVYRQTGFVRGGGPGANLGFRLVRVVELQPAP